MVTNKYIIILAIVASVVVGAACAKDESAPQEGTLRSFGKRVVDQGSNILSHIPLVNKFFGSSDKKKAPEAQADKQQEKATHEEVEKKVEEPAAPVDQTVAQEEAKSQVGDEKVPAQEETPVEHKSQQQASKVDESQ